MKYLLLVYGNEEIWGSADSEEAFRAFVGRVDAWNAELRASGELLSADGLAAPMRNLRLRDGEPVVSDGPYLEAKEHGGSFSVLDVASHERALELLRSYPGVALGGGAELWPVMTHGAPDA
jgi:hypothetical protein